MNEPTLHAENQKFARALAAILWAIRGSDESEREFSTRLMAIAGEALHERIMAGNATVKPPTPESPSE